MTPSRRVLILAYHFPPIGGAGVQHTLKLVRYLPESSYQPLVVTGYGGQRQRWTPVDRSLEREIPAEARVVRVARPEPQQPPWWRDRAERWVRLPSAWHRWWVEGCIEAARGLDPADVLYASMSPYTSASAAARIATERGIPWVAGLRDPWALDEMMVYPSRIHQYLEQRAMRKALASASAIVMNTPEAAARLVHAFPEFASRDVVSITNGFDTSDFLGEPPVRGDSSFRIAHTGYLHTEAGQHQRRTGLLRRMIGGAADGVDILARSHVYLLRAIDLLFERRPELGSRVEVHLAGVVSAEDERVARAHGPHVRLLGYLPHEASVSLVRSADLLFLPMQGLPPGRRATIVPGKTYEYLAAGPPILAAVPEGDARDFLEEGRCAFIVQPNDVGGMATAIEEAFNRWDAGLPAPVPSPDFLARFDRRKLTADLVKVFDRVIDDRRSSATSASRAKLRARVP